MNVGPGPRFFSFREFKYLLNRLARGLQGMAPVVLQQCAVGFRAAVEGFRFAYSMRAVRRAALRGWFWSLFGAALLVAGAMLCVLPVWASSLALSAATGWECALGFWQSFNLVLSFTAWLIPSASLLILRSLTFSHSFLHSLRHLSPDFADRLSQVPERGCCGSFVRFLAHSGRKIMVLVLIWVVGWIPVLGPLVFRLCIYLQLARPTATLITLDNIAFAMFCAFTPKSWQFYAVSVLAGARSVAFELMGPYTRRRSHIRPEHGLEHGDPNLFDARGYAVAAFGLPFMLALAVPGLGLAVWEFAQGAAAHFLVSTRRALLVE